MALSTMAADPVIVSQAPNIAPVPAGTPRPLWSVMIPTYNCAQYLRQTLASVLTQDPGPDQMQIEIVDDCSTKDDPETVVREAGDGRFAFYRQPVNVGATRNFNTCLERSRGCLVHILHGDDLVLPGFYARVAAAATRHQDCAIFFVRSFIIDECGDIENLTPRMPWLERASRDPGSLLYYNDVRTPGVVVRREFYERNGPFLTQLVHVADWEMWLRAITRGSGFSLNQVLCSYRSFAGNDSGRLVVTAENLHDCLRLGDILAARQSGFDRGKFNWVVLQLAKQQADSFRIIGRVDAVAANETVAHELFLSVPFHARLWRAIRAFRIALRP